MILDNWQKEVLAASGNICLRSGRQVGKSTIISIKAAEFAVNNPNKTIIVIAAVERQASLLFEKTLNYLYEKYPKMIAKGVKRPTKHIIQLINGSKIYCLPIGISAKGIRGYTVDLLIVDEAQFIDESAWSALTPMLVVSHGTMILLSTPHGKGGFFYSCFQNPEFKSFHISSEDCPRANKEFLASEKRRMTKVQYAQEYLGEFVDELRQFFPSELIKSCMKISRQSSIPFSLPVHDKFLGVDVARMGADESVLVSVERINKEKIKMIDMEITEKTLLTDTIARIKLSDKKWNFKKIYIDTGGLGVGVFDPLLQDEQTKRKVIPIDNAKRSLDRDEKHHKTLMKQDLYENLLWLMESGNLELFDEPEIFLSLSSIQLEITNAGDMIFTSIYNHITEALIRAAWSVKDKTLNIWCH